ncbi:hypothetical protein CRUP_008216 [Coryphaenoides rupestris]|nr:hypothetical protein CRUP_008216 [Coryphaenoides rupestris]
MSHHREEDLIGIPFPNHSSDILCSLNEQRRDGLFCDVILIVHDQQYQTHRSVLAACSQYFKKLFTVATAAATNNNSHSDRGDHHRHHHHRSQQQQTAAAYEIDFVAPESLTAILEFAYTSTLTVTASNVKEILNAARLLEIPTSQFHHRHHHHHHHHHNNNNNNNNSNNNSSNYELHTNNTQSLSPDTMRGKQESMESRALKDFSIESLLQEGLYPRISSALDGKQQVNFSPLLPSFYPSMWAAEFSGFPQQLLEPGHHHHFQRLQRHHHHQQQQQQQQQQQHPQNGGQTPRGRHYPRSRPLDLAVKREVIKEEVKEEVTHGGSLLHGDFLKELVGSGLGGSGAVTPGGGGSLTPALEGHVPLGQIKDEADFRSYLNFLSSASHLGSLFPPWQLEEERKLKPKAAQQCPICNKVIQGAGKLPRHMRTHTGEKPYMCTICEVRFTSGNNNNNFLCHAAAVTTATSPSNQTFAENAVLLSSPYTGVKGLNGLAGVKGLVVNRGGVGGFRGRVAGPRIEGGRGEGKLVAQGEEEEEEEVAVAVEEHRGRAGRQRGVFSFTLAGDKVLSHAGFYAPPSDPWTVRPLPIPEPAN